jgi:peptidoglycan/xylan/chitin deacetylase (PgdA/CDA1 family)
MARLTILIYHRVLAVPDALMPDLPDAVRFEAEVRLLKRCFEVLPLGDAVRRLRAGRIRRPAASITFDDGYADNAEIALPVLRRLGVPATFFVSTGFLNGGCMWNDLAIEAIRTAPLGPFDLEDFGLGRPHLGDATSRRAVIDVLLERLKYLPMAERIDKSIELAQRASDSPLPRMMMTEAQVRELRDAGMEIGAHTVNHPILSRLAADRARDEIVHSKQRLEQILTAPVRLFAYPNGRPNKDYGREHVDMVRSAGFDAAVSTASGVASARSDRFQLPRFAPWPKNRLRLGLELARNLARANSETV